MSWQDLIKLAREMAASPPSGRIHQAQLRLAVSTTYYAMYHTLARSNADLLAGASEAERNRPEWARAYQALGGDYADQRLQSDYSDYPEVIRVFADTFLALHQQRLLADEDPWATFTSAEAQAWVERATDAINAFLSTDPMQLRSFALEMLLRPPGSQEPED